MNNKLIRLLTEADFYNIVKEAVNNVLNEIGDMERGQYALGAVQARAHPFYIRYKWLILNILSAFLCQLLCYSLNKNSPHKLE